MSPPLIGGVVRPTAVVRSSGWRRSAAGYPYERQPPRCPCSRVSGPALGVTHLAENGPRAAGEFPVQPLISDLRQPLPCLAVDIMKIGELAKRPEVLANITDADTLHLSFFPAGRRITGTWKETVLLGEGQEAWMEVHQFAVVFVYRGGQIVIPDFFAAPAHGVEGMNVTTYESFEGLIVRKLQIKHAAVALYQSESVELAFIAGIIQRTKVAPVHFESLARIRLHANEGTLSRWRWSILANKLLQDAAPPGVAERLQPLHNHGCTGERILPEEVGDHGFE